MGYNRATTIMKKYIVMIMALVFSVAFMNSEAGKPSTRKQVRNYEKQSKVEKSKQQHRQDSIRANHKTNKLERDYDNADKSEGIRDGQEIEILCLDESIDTDEYLAGLGVSAPKDNATMALRAAREAAITDITSRYIGVVKAGAMDFVSETATRNNGTVSEAELKGIAINAGEKAFNKVGKIACRKLEKNDYGEYVAYVAVQIPLDELASEMKQNMSVNQVEMDSNKFLNLIQQEIDRQAK